MNHFKRRLAGAAVAALAGAVSPRGPALAADERPGGLPPADNRRADNPPARMDPSFDVLLKKSIFSRDRSRDSGPASTSPATGPARVLSPEQSVALRGVLCPDEEYVAFMENIQTGQISIVKAGDEIGRGRVAAITLDGLAYDAGGKVHQIRLGQDLTGETAATGGGSYTTPGSGGSTPGAAAPAPPAGDPAQQAVLERLRQKRLQEGGR
jgi:hypothetical protein